MKQTVKKIIAREGLIILSLLILAGASAYIRSLITEQRAVYESNVQEIELVIKEGKYLKPQGIRVQFPKNTSEDVINKTLERDYPHIKRDDWIILDSPTNEIANAYDEKGNPVFDSIIYKINFSDVSFGLLILAYPLYLVLSFIVWAFKTLRTT